MSPADVVIWIERVASIFVQLLGLWNAAKGGDPHEELAASLELVREIKRRQALEELRK